MFKQLRSCWLLIVAASLRVDVLCLSVLCVNRGRVHVREDVAVFSGVVGVYVRLYTPLD